MHTDISIVTPVFNESENIDELCAALDGYAAGKPYTLELIFVDDGSSDDSFEKLRAYRFQNVKARLVSLSKNYGSHAAVRAGMQQAGGDYTMLFSADLQEPLEMIGTLFETIGQGYDAVYVQKGSTQVKRRESFFSRMYARLIRRFAVAEFPMGGLNNFMISAKVREVLNRNVEGNSSVVLQLVNLGYKHTLITVDYVERKRGVSKWTLSKKIKLFVDSFIAFSYAPIRAITILGILLLLSGGVYALYIIVVKIFNLFPFEAGFPSLISVLLLGFGITNLSLGVLAEYLWRTLDTSRNRPVFLIDRVLDVTPQGDETK